MTGEYVCQVDCSGTYPTQCPQYCQEQGKSSDGYDCTNTIFYLSENGSNATSSSYGVYLAVIDMVLVFIYDIFLITYVILQKRTKQQNWWPQNYVQLNE